MGTSKLLGIKDELGRLRQDNTVSLLRQLLDSQERRLASMKRFVQSLDQLEGDMKDPEFNVHHPLDAYRFIKNHSVVYNDSVTNLLNELKTHEEEQDEITKLARKLTAFHKDDLLGAIQGLIRIQDVYGLETQDLADGNVRGLHRRKMTALECQDMMIVAFHSDLVDLALEWLEVALQRIEAGDDTITYTKILCKAAAVAFNVKYELTAAMLYEYVLERNPRSRYHRQKMKYYQGYNTQDVVRYPLPHEGFHKACQMTIENKNHIRREHVCMLLDNGHPLLRYQPAKVEVLSQDPYISVYHDCFNLEFLTKLIELAKPQIDRSKVGGKGNEYTAHFRTSKGLFLEFTNPLLKFYKYVGALTMLRHESFEQFQVANYGIGGHYEMHGDFLDSNEKDHKINNRIATFMIYLTDVEEGGATAFSKLDVSIAPEAGKAVFWYNLHPDGERNYLTAHGACPVISGDKWVGNIWIKEQGQEFTRPCKLDKNDLKWT
ncbi:prolyl 4-hydroxylase subunit alpha-1-like isoform X2 [Mercenaria mercenaria]|uniref:prolyl 4-hydroxylase subunit alpha-1-like isoform X2 n=1 Tax=Mercenaria mercenaria TaxID=6596 RepID=UPI00234EE308|nr:prolyl 4-hydroxylase subunit alpha-1-like isoform X2 [Mercenaria mercenaria]